MDCRFFEGSEHSFLSNAQSLLVPAEKWRDPTSELRGPGRGPRHRWRQMPLAGTRCVNSSGCPGHSRGRANQTLALEKLCAGGVTSLLWAEGREMRGLRWPGLFLKRIVEEGLWKGDLEERLAGSEEECTETWGRTVEQRKHRARGRRLPALEAVV